ncbi:MAG: hypothetical protein KDI13_05740 [Alphaproteobacteria bacterium]|nr:hypothetical protein [Alphaproteobacteria bacterium]
MRTHKQKITLALFAIATLGLSACGIKPSHVDPPAGAEDVTFPRTYPDPSTDP